MERFLLIHGARPQKTARSRYEFRIWPRVWPRAATLAQRFWPLVGAERRSDIYLLTAHNPFRLVKLRGGTRLETESRGRDVGPLQYWTNQPYPCFPLSRPAVRALADELGVGCLPPDAGLSPDCLVAGLRASAPEVLSMTAHKSRQLFQMDGSRIEICQVAIAGQTRLTLAVEDPEFDSAIQTLDGLGIGLLSNRSYGDMMRREALTAVQTATPQIEQSERNIS